MMLRVAESRRTGDASSFDIVITGTTGNGSMNRHRVRLERIE
ncbi:MAG: hypothetical protein QM756_34610 [Polyangiaceae bacterium]